MEVFVKLDDVKRHEFFESPRKNRGVSIGEVQSPGYMHKMQRMHHVVSYDVIQQPHQVLLDRLDALKLKM